MNDPAEIKALPAVGYPSSEQAVTDWFRRSRGRDPSELEVGQIIAAMAQRDATPPLEGPHADPAGWRTEPMAPPATRR